MTNDRKIFLKQKYTENKLGVLILKIKDVFLQITSLSDVIDSRAEIVPER